MPPHPHRNEDVYTEPVFVALKAASNHVLAAGHVLPTKDSPASKAHTGAVQPTGLTNDDLYDSLAKYRLAAAWAQLPSDDVRNVWYMALSRMRSYLYSKRSPHPMYAQFALTPAPKRNTTLYEDSHFVILRSAANDLLAQGYALPLQKNFLPDPTETTRTLSSPRLTNAPSPPLASSVYHPFAASQARLDLLLSTLSPSRDENDESLALKESAATHDDLDDGTPPSVDPQVPSTANAEKPRAPSQPLTPLAGAETPSPSTAKVPRRFYSRERARLAVSMLREEPQPLGPIAELTDEEVYDTFYKWSRRPDWNLLSSSDVRSYWSKALVRFKSWERAEVRPAKLQGRDLMPPAPDRNTSVYSMALFIDLKYATNDVLAAGYPLTLMQKYLPPPTAQDATTPSGATDSLALVTASYQHHMETDDTISSRVKRMATRSVDSSGAKGTSASQHPSSPYAPASSKQHKSMVIISSKVISTQPSSSRRAAEEKDENSDDEDLPTPAHRKRSHPSKAHYQATSSHHTRKSSHLSSARPASPLSIIPYRNTASAPPSTSKAPSTGSSLKPAHKKAKLVEEDPESESENVQPQFLRPSADPFLKDVILAEFAHLTESFNFQLETSKSRLVDLYDLLE